MSGFEALNGPAVVEAFRGDLAVRSGLRRDDVGRSDWLVTSTSDRLGSGSVAFHRFGRFGLLWCDPDVVGGVAELVDGLAGDATADDVGAALTAAGFERGGDLILHVVHRLGLRPVDAVEGLEGLVTRRLDPSEPTDLALLDGLLRSVDAAEADEAELDLDDLDPLLIGVIDGEVLCAEAGWRPFDSSDRFADIAVLTRPDRRRHGVGIVAVHAAAIAAFDAGRFPLYRCTPDNVASLALVRRLGLLEAAHLHEFRAGGAVR